MLEAKRIFMYSTIKKIIFVLYIAITPLMAQQNNSILGTWEGIPIIQNDDNSSNQKRQISFIMFGEDGYYFQASFPADRPVPRTVIDKRSREDLLSQFKDLITRVGTYRVVENTLVQTIQSSSDMIEEGGEIVITFRIDGDRLLFFNHLSGEKPISIF